MGSIEVPVLAIGGVGVMKRQPRPADCAGAVMREGGIAEKPPAPRMGQHELLRACGGVLRRNAGRIVGPVIVECVGKVCQHG